MGYISFKKSTGDVDLLPADNVMHVASNDVNGVIIEYGITGGTTATTLKADITFASDWADTGGVTYDVLQRNAVNDALSIAAGTSGPAIPVQMPKGMFVSAVLIVLTAT
jgi:hypothetical protein